MIILVTGALLWSACSTQKAGAELVESKLDAFPAKTGTIKLEEGSDKQVVFVGEGEVFEKDSRTPLVLYSANSKGAADFASAIASPFTRINPAVFDMIETSLKDVTIGIHNSGSGFAGGVVVDCTTYKRFLIDENYVVYPITEADAYLQAKTGGPFINIRLFRSTQEKIDLGLLSIKVETASGGKLSSSVAGDGSLIVSGVPNETLKITVESPGINWSFEFYPIFRGAVPGIVYHDFWNVP